MVVLSTPSFSTVLDVICSSVPTGEVWVVKFSSSLSEALLITSVLFSSLSGWIVVKSRDSAFSVEISSSEAEEGVTTKMSDLIVAPADSFPSIGWTVVKSLVSACSVEISTSVAEGVTTKMSDLIVVSAASFSAIG